ncbi:protein of unknown function (plasmid) [Azospirillum baldaniorum]|uniref:Uncharacterized protein n=1 Tax=Azospirillum baldaniorum TaxID=1064539 RepID=A0A9P1NNU8_9PROT|nr:protein of unknown function [Azospirillum baldaniorum]
MPQMRLVRRRRPALRSWRPSLPPRPRRRLRRRRRLRPFSSRRQRPRPTRPDGPPASRAVGEEGRPTAWGVLLHFWVRWSALMGGGTVPPNNGGAAWARNTRPPATMHTQLAAHSRASAAVARPRRAASSTCRSGGPSSRPWRWSARSTAVRRG